uniref:DUF7136 domain-containing protein n=1 Tax=Fusarium oxysporum (strain Fo5176) TaxID=660025 RepID=A0A0D2XXK3_FUSOF
MNVSLLLGVFLGTFSVLGMQAKEKPSPPFPIDLGVSLIFPQPNETYRPVYPFPIVFALTGATKAGFKLQWRLEGNWTTPIKKEDVPIVYGSAPDWLYSSGVGAWMEFAQRALPPRDPAHSVLGQQNNAKGVTGDRRSESCVVVTDQEGEGDPCSIDTGHELATMVRAEMLRYAECPDNQSWPDEKNLLGPDSCRPLYPSSKDAEDVANLMLPAALTAVVMGTIVVAFFAM